MTNFIQLYCIKKDFDYFRRAKGGIVTVEYNPSIKYFYSQNKPGDYILVHRDYYYGFSFDNFVIQESFFIKVTSKDEKKMTMCLVTLG